MEKMIHQVGRALQRVLIERANELGRSSGLIQRQRKLDGATFAQTLIISELARSSSSLAELCQAAVQSGVVISRQGLNKRFTRQGAAFMQGMVAVTVEEMIRSDPAARHVLSTFSQVVLCDSTTIDLPDELHEVWHGCGGNQQATSAALKVNLHWDWLSGQVLDVVLQDGKAHDRAAVEQMQSLQPHALLIRDTGYFKLAEFAALREQDVYVLSRYKAGTAVFDRHGELLDLVTWLDHHCPGSDQIVDVRVWLGATAQVPMRLIAQRVPAAVADQRRQRLAEEARRRQEPIRQASYALAAWTLLVTTAPSEYLTAAGAMLLMRVRWQIELVFKLWKTEFQVDTWHTAHPWRILCEVYARLIAALVSQWFMTMGCWHDDRRSTVRAVQTIRKKAWHMGAVLTRWDALCDALRSLYHCLDNLPPMHRSRRHPRLFQLLEAYALEAIA